MAARRSIVAVSLTMAVVLAACGGGGATRTRHIESIFADFDHLDGQLTKAIDEASKGGSVDARIDNIARAKLAIIDGEFSQPVDGVKGSEWFRNLDCVDMTLGRAKQIEDFGLTAGHANVQITSWLKAAQTCKQRLEAALHAATSTSSSSPSSSSSSSTSSTTTSSTSAT